MCGSVKARIQYQASCSVSLHLSLETLNLGLTNSAASANQPAPEICLSLLLPIQMMELQKCVATFSFWVDARDQTWVLTFAQEALDLPRHLSSPASVKLNESQVCLNPKRKILESST